MIETDAQDRKRTRAKLAMIARQLNCAAGISQKLPPLFLFTDERRLADPRPAIAALPRGSGVILRHYGDDARRKLAHELAQLCRARGLHLFVAGDGACAHAIAAAGIHLPAHQKALLPRLRHLYPRLLVTLAAHHPSDLTAGERLGADGVFLSPVFPTASHAGQAAIGPWRFSAWTARMRLPVYALGGMTAQNARRLLGSGVAGIGAIGALSPCL